MSGSARSSCSGPKFPCCNFQSSILSFHPILSSHLPLPVYHVCTSSPKTCMHACTWCTIYIAFQYYISFSLYIYIHNLHICFTRIISNRIWMHPLMQRGPHHLIPISMIWNRDFSANLYLFNLKRLVCINWDLWGKSSLSCSYRTGAATSYNRWVLGVVLIFWSSSITQLPMKHGFSNVSVLFLLINVEFMFNVVDIFLIIISLNPWTPFKSSIYYRIQKHRKKIHKW